MKGLFDVSTYPPYAGDPILSLMEQFNADTRSEKVNLVLVFIITKTALFLS